MMKEEHSDSNVRVWLSVLGMAAIMALLLFVPAGTIRYWQAWVYLAVYFAASALIVLYLMRNDRALADRRMRGGPTAEKERTQQVIMLFLSLGFVASLVVPAFDVRYGWSSVPLWLVILGDAMIALWFYVVFLVSGRTPSLLPRSRSPKARK